METSRFADGGLELDIGPISRLRINRPGKANAMTMPMWEGLIHACNALVTAPDVRVLILSGEGTHFCAGADISEFPKHYASEDSAEVFNELYRSAENAVRGLPFPVIAMMRGGAFGGGLGLALSADFRFADQSARFSITASKLGITYNAEDASHLIDKIGSVNAKDMLYSSRTVQTDEALAWGLIDRVFAAKDLVGEVEAYAQLLCTRSKASHRAMKQIIDSLGERDTALLLSLRPIYNDLFHSADFHEGRAAFLEKREPNFK